MTDFRYLGKEKMLEKRNAELLNKAADSDKFILTPPSRSCCPFVHLRRHPRIQIISMVKEHFIDYVQFSSVAQSCPTLCDPMNCSTPGLPVHHHLPELVMDREAWRAAIREAAKSRTRLSD